MLKNYSIFLIIFVSFISGCTNKIKEDFIKEVKFDSQQINLTSFSVDKKYKTLDNTQSFRSDDNFVLKIHSEANLELAEAHKNIDKKSTEIKIMFAPQQVPYMGQITKDIRCTQDIQISNSVVENEKEISLLFNLTATERLIYGSCIPEQEIYKSQLLLLYCKSNKTLYEIKYFYAKSQTYKSKIAECL